MAIPSQGEIEVPLLMVLTEYGGSAKPRDVYAKIAAMFPDLTVSGEIDGSTRGVWTITPKGIERLSRAAQGSRQQPPSSHIDLSLRTSSIVHAMRLRREY